MADFDETVLGDETSPQQHREGRRRNVLEPGNRVGRYVVLSRLGSGGMGVVYAAFDPELDRKVAVKVLHRRRADTTSSASGAVSGGHNRLLREAQAMAKLSHPHVVTVHDVGEHEGRVFLAMEFVQGQTARQWMKKQARQWPEVLRVFRAAGQGLAEAHRAGLVHRDFKPDNVMVADDGGVFVMDFGLARNVSSRDLRPEVGVSVSDLIGSATDGNRAGTPAYMPPEQHMGAEVDARGDQFSFCVALYQALYQDRPFRGETLGELSLSVTAGEVREAPAQTKVPAWVRRVALRGLSIEPEERFPSMEALLDALSKDPRQRRRRVGGLSLAGLAVAAGAFGVFGLVTSESEVCRGASAKLEGVWDETRRSDVEDAITGTGLSYAAGTWDRVERGLDEYARAFVGGHVDACEATEVRREQSVELMDARMTCLDGRRAEFSAIIDVLAGADVTTVQRAVQAVHDLPSVEACADLEFVQARVKPPTDPQARVEVDRLRGQLAKSAALELAGHYEASLEAAEAVKVSTTGHGYLPLRAEAQYALGRARERTGQYEPALVALEEAYFLAREIGEDRLAAKTSAMIMAVVGYRLARLDQAQLWGRIAESDASRTNDEEARARIHSHWGAIHYSQGEMEEAQASFATALEMTRALVPADHPHMAQGLNNLGGLMFQRGQVEEALPLLEEAAKAIERGLGPEHPNLVTTHANLAMIERSLGHGEKAKAHIARALEIGRASLGEAHPDIGLALMNHTTILIDDERFEDAIGTLDQAIELLRDMGPNHPHLGLAHATRATVLVELGRLEDAKVDLSTATEVFEKGVGADHPLSGYADVVKARIALEEERFSDASEDAERGMTKMDAMDASPDDRGMACFLLARALWRGAGKSEDPEQEKRRALELAQKARVKFESAGPIGADELVDLDAWLAKRARHAAKP